MYLWKCLSCESGCLERDGNIQSTIHVVVISLVEYTRWNCVVVIEISHGLKTSYEGFGLVWWTPELSVSNVSNNLTQFLFEILVTVTEGLLCFTHTPWKCMWEAEEEEAESVWSQTSAKSSVIKFHFLNHKEFICNTTPKRTHAAVCKSCNANLTEAAESNFYQYLETKHQERKTKS